MARLFVGGRSIASTIINFFFHSIAIGLRFSQLCFDFHFDGDTETVFHDFRLLYKSVTCSKLFISSYRQIKVDGLGMFALSCLIGLFIHLFTTVIHLYRNHRYLATYWIFGMAVTLASGGVMLVIEIPDNYAWHNTAVESILVIIVCLETVLLVLQKMSEHGDSDNLVRDLNMIFVETSINSYQLGDYLVMTHIPWGAEKILHLIGSCLAVLSGLGQIGWLIYKACTRRVIAAGEEQASVAAIDGNGDGDVEAQMGIEVVEVVEDEEGDNNKTTGLHFLVPTMEIEMTTRAAIEDDGRDNERVVLSPDKHFEVVVASPA